MGEIRDADKYLICHFVIENRRRNNVLGSILLVGCIHKMYLQDVSLIN